MTMPKFRELAENAFDVISRVDVDGNYLWVSPSVEDHFGYSPDELLSQPLRDIIHPDDGSWLDFDNFIDRRSVEMRVKHAEGDWIWTESSGRYLEATDEHPAEIHLTTRVIHRRRLAEEKAKRHALELDLTIDHAPIGFALVGLDGTWIRANNKLLDMLGMQREELLTKTFQDVTHPDDLNSDLELLERTLSGEIDDYTLVKRYYRSDGRIMWGRLSVVLLRIDGEPLYFISQIEDVTAQKEASDALAFRALHDPLTGLPNRDLLMDRLQHELERSARNGDKVALLFIDLDNFKVFNDSLGHQAGDEVLKEVAQAIERLSRDIDTVGRLGGDEFIIICPELESEDSAKVLAERIRDGIAQPIKLGERTIRLTISIGVAVSEHDDKPDVLLRKADATMFVAKDRGRNRWEVYEHTIGQLASERLSLEEDMRDGLLAGQFIVHYQPIVRLDTREHVGSEALVRWQHPERGLMAPDTFLDVAEASGLINTLGIAVLRHACQTLAAGAVRGTSISVNFSAQQLDHPEFSKKVEAIVTKSGISPHQLVLEMTENTIMRSSHSSFANLNRLRELGIGLSLDDFGTGYASLSALTSMPATQIKIDKSFVQSLHDRFSSGHKIAESLVVLGRTLGIEVVAEGVETEEQARALSEFGCTLAQGYLFGKPQPVSP